MTKRLMGFILTIGIAAPLCGCDALQGYLGLDTVEVVLNNQADFPVDVDLYLSDQKDIPEVLLITVGEHLQYTLAPGTSQRFTRSCDDLKAIMVYDADLETVGGPDTESNVLRTDGDFNCADKITFTFDHSAAISDFNVTVDVRPQTPFLP